MYMIIIDNNYTTKYFITDDIIDCSTNNSINIEKLKDNYNIDNTNILYGSNEYENSINDSTNTNTKDKLSKNKSKSKSNYNKNKNDRINNSQETITHIKLHRTYNTNYNKKYMSKMSAKSRISEYAKRNIMLDSYPRAKINLI